jgi:methyl-accepting chemotaxis protein
VSSETASSRRSVEASTESVTRLEETFTTMDQRMRDLSERTASTGMIVKSLEDVAERTHVLATNAPLRRRGRGNLEPASV